MTIPHLGLPETNWISYWKLSLYQYFQFQPSSFSLIIRFSLHLSSKNTHKWEITVLHLLRCPMIWYLQLLVTGLWSVNEGDVCQAPPIFKLTLFSPFNKYLVGRPSNFSFTSFSIYWRLSPEPITTIVKWFSNSTIHFTFTGWHYTESTSFLGIHGFLFYLMVYNLLLTFIFISKCWLGHWIPLQAGSFVLLTYPRHS